MKRVESISPLRELLMASKGKGDRLTFGGWTAPKGLLTIGLFLALAFISEFFMVSFFAGSGLTETYAYPLPVSPLFHLLPLAVILVLVSSWMYLTRHIAMRPHRISPSKVSKSRRRRSRRTTKSARGIMGAVKKLFSKISSVFRSSGVSSTPQRLSFGSLAFESTATVLTIFLLSIILLSALVYPNLFTNFAAGFYSKTSPLQGFMQSLADVLVPIASGLDSIAPGFRSAFEGIVSARLPSLTEGDLLWRYVFCQNAAAWVSALAALAYVKNFSNTYRSRK
jgi:hypothetical protein